MKESKTLEFKSAITNSFLKTVSAFSNFGSGEILFGVNDDGSICGIDNPRQVCLDIENKINDSISPKPDYTLSIDKKSKVITLKVFEGAYKPYMYKGKAYRRSDSASIEVDPIERKRLVLEGQNLYYESLVCDKQDLKFSYFENVLKNKLGIDKLTNDVIRTFGFLNKDKKYNVAAGLFADNNNFYGIDIARFGESISEILDRGTFYNMSILEQYDKAVMMYKRYYQLEKIEGIERKLVEKIPETAFREAIANALVHRTWDINSHIKVSMFSDRIEIVSIGGLPNGLTKEEYLNGNISNLRNPIIGNIFFRLHYIEMFGTGIKRIKQEYKACVNKPEFKIFDNSVMVVLPILKSRYEVTSMEKQIIKLLENGMILSSKEIAEELQFTKATTVRNLNELIDKGYIKKHGKGRATKYSM